MPNIQLPTPQQEDWKYTNLSRYYTVQEDTNARVPNTDLADSDLPLQAFPTDATAVVTGGNFRRDLLRLTEGFAAEASPFAATSEPTFVERLLSAQGAITLQTTLSANTQFTNPIQLIWANTPHSCTQIVAEPNSAATVIDQQAYTGQTTHRTRLQVTAGADLTYLWLPQTERTLAELDVELAEGAKLTIFTAPQVAAFCRLTVNATHVAQNSVLTLNGLQLAVTGQHSDLHLTCTHTQQNCQSNVHCQQLAGDNSRAIFQGKFVVAKAALGTKANMMCRNNLLAGTGRCISKPELEIYADAVECSHGSTTGSLDDNALFYLQSRGITPERARQMMLESLITSSIPENLPAELHKYLVTTFNEALNGRS